MSEGSKEVFSHLIKWMKVAGELESTTGAFKKQFVLDKIREELNLDVLLEDIIITVIDLLIDIDKGRIVINPVVKSKFKSMICCNSQKK